MRARWGSSARLQSFFQAAARRGTEAKPFAVEPAPAAVRSTRHQRQPSRPIHTPSPSSGVPKPSSSIAARPGTQYAKSAITIGTRVSCNPRSAPAATACSPSNSWNAAATSRYWTAKPTSRGVARGVGIDIERQQRERRSEHHRRGRDHEPGAHRDRRPAGARDARAVARAVEEADPDRRRLADPERHLEGERGDLQRQRVRGELVAPISAHQERRAVEQPAFGHDSQRYRRSQHHQPAEILPVGDPQPPEGTKPPQLPVVQDDRDIDRQPQPRGHAAGDRRSVMPNAGTPKFPNTSA